MIRIDAALQERGLKSRMTLQVHDELVFEVPENEIDTMRTLSASRWKRFIALTVPLLVEIGVGRIGETWSEQLNPQRALDRTCMPPANARILASDSGLQPSPWPALPFR